MRHIKGIGFCKVYGAEKTHLTLSDKAEASYTMTDAMMIYEKEIEREDGEPEYRYYIKGEFELDDMNAFALNKFLEEIYNTN